MAPTLRTIAESPRFQYSILAVIVANALVLGLETYSGIEEQIGGLLSLLDSIFLGIFCVEIGIRIGAYGSRPQDFFRDPWNVFDFVVVGAAFLPGLRGDATLLRLVRLLRVVRLVSVMPDLRVLIRGMADSLAPIASLAGVALLVMYVYGMVGWILFGDELPDRFGNIGEALLTLFVVMTLEAWPDVLAEVREVNSAGWIYLVSYVLVASFLIINVVIAIIIGAVEKAREADLRERIKETLEDERAGDAGEAERIERRIDSLRQALDDLERELGHGSAEQRAGVRMASKGRLKP